MKKIILLLLFVYSYEMTMAQNVGIGTTTPAEKLQVAGNIKADTIKPGAIILTPNAGAGKVLTSDVAGNASWQSSISEGNVGFGGWGDCRVQNISAFNPVVAADGAAGDFFGRSVAVSGNFAIAGAPLDNNGFFADQGAAYIFFYNGTNWVEQQKLAASDGAPNDQFGWSVSISGNYAVVGAQLDDNGSNADQGSAYIFFYNGNTWTQVQKIEHISGFPGDRFGYSVCMKGDKVIIGSPYQDIGADINQGSADVYAFNGSTWIFQERLVAADGLANDNFGFSVTIENNIAFAGAPYDDAGANADQGSVYQFLFNGTNWVMQQKFVGTVSPAANDRFGWSVSLSAPFCVVGEPFSGLSNEIGAAHLYHPVLGVWSYHQTITPPVALTGNGEGYAGMSVSLSGDKLIIAAPSWSENIFNYQGKLFIYKNLSGLWQLHEDFIDPAGTPGDGISLNAAVDNNRFVFGVPDAPTNVSRGKVVFGKIE